jgi:hypothetical protein
MRSFDADRIRNRPSRQRVASVWPFRPASIYQAILPHVSELPAILADNRDGHGSAPLGKSAMKRARPRFAVRFAGYSRQSVGNYQWQLLADCCRSAESQVGAGPVHRPPAAQDGNCHRSPVPVRQQPGPYRIHRRTSLSAAGRPGPPPAGLGRWGERLPDWATMARARPEYQFDQGVGGWSVTRLRAAPSGGAAANLSGVIAQLSPLTVGHPAFPG